MKKAFVLLLIILLAFVLESRIQNLSRREEVSKKSNKSEKDTQDDSDESSSDTRKNKKDKNSQKSQKNDLEPICGDGIVEEPENCEEGSSTPHGYICQSCLWVEVEEPVEPVEPVCGDGIVEQPENCEEGSSTPHGYICQSCLWVEVQEPVCGDGIIEWPENCEEGSELPEGHQCSNCQVICVDCPQNFNYYPCLEACSTTFLDSFSCGETQCSLTSCTLPSDFSNKQFLPQITDQLAEIATETELQELLTHQDLVFYVNKAPASANIKVGSSQLATDLTNLVYADPSFVQALQGCTSGVFPIFSGETPSI